MTAPTITPARLGMFSSLGIRNYRTWMIGALISNVGTWMGRVGQDWLVLTHLTDHSALALGVVAGLQFAAFPLLAPWTGWIADRFPKRATLLLTQSTMGLATLLLAILTLTDAVQLWMVYVLAAITGVAAAIDNPARQTYVAEMVPKTHLANAVSLNSASFNAGRLIGPGLAGLIIAATSTGMALLINALSFGAVICSLLRLHPEAMNPAPRARAKGGIREGLHIVAHRPDLLLIMWLVFILGTFGMNYQVTTALMATSVFGRGVHDYGLLGSILAIGSLSAALLAARRPKPGMPVLIWALSAFVICSAAAALAPTYLIFALTLIPVGLSALTALITANTMVQLRVEPELRGRVMALYMALFMGGTPLGAPLIGWIGARFGARWTIGIGSVAVALSLVIGAIVLLRSDRHNATDLANRLRGASARHRPQPAPEPGHLPAVPQPRRSAAQPAEPAAATRSASSPIR